MNDRIKNILVKLNIDVGQDKLLEYLNDELLPEEQQQVEQSLNEDGFLNDAADGLETFKDKKELQKIVQKLNLDLTAQLGKRKNRKRKKVMAVQPWIYYTVIFILLISVITWVVIRKMQT